MFEHIPTSDEQYIIDPSKVIRGTWLCPDPQDPLWTAYQDAVLVYDQDGQIIDFFESNLWAKKYPNIELPSTQNPQGVWLPGFVDTHVHYPQTAIIGSASGPLLEWLDTSVFPEEAKFAKADYAQYVAHRFSNQLLKNGTTSAAVFSSSHVEATHLLFKVFAEKGLNGELGLTLMDRGAPNAVLCPADEALAGCEQLIETWHGYDNGRLNFCITPRFGLSCTPRLLTKAGQLAQTHQLMVQTHLSENPAELVATAETFPQSKDYLGVYEDLGLLHERSLFAHCIWLSDTEWQRFAQAQAAVSHCPDSNFFLGSGQMSLSAVTSRHIKLGLGSDVGAGRSFSMRKACARAYDASRISTSQTTPDQLLWYATRGGALALNKPRLGVLEQGAYADVICIEPPPSFVSDQVQTIQSPLVNRSMETLIAQLIFCEDWDGTLEVRTRGLTRWSKGS